MKRYLFLKAALLIVVIVPLAIVAIMPFTNIKGLNDTAFALTEADCRGCHGTSTTTMHHAFSGPPPSPIKCPSASPYIVCPTNTNYSCNSCHLLVWKPDISAYDWDIVKDCTRCHKGADHVTVHENKVVLDSTVCSQCHVANVVTEHKKYNQGCSVCHDSTNPTIIAALNKAKTSPPIYCSDCHGVTNHAAAHDHAKIDSATCLQCHQANVVTEHVTNQGLTCATCHSSTDQKVINAINKGKGPTGLDVFCYDCHGTIDHTAAHDKATIPYPDCGQCHAANVVTEHANQYLDCAVCHSSTDQNVLNAIAAGKGANGTYIYCATCHVSFGNHVKQHDKTFMPAGACTDPSYATDVVSYHESKSTSTNQIYCFRCHTSINSAVISAINSGMAGSSVTCSSCHPGKCTPNQPPKAVIAVTPGQTVQTGQSVTLSGSGSTDPDGTITSYAWNFGDASAGTGVTTSHAYTAAGTYTVTLTVTDNLGATGTATTTVTVQAAPVSTSVYADEVLWIQNLSNVTYSDSNGSKTDITTRFKDNILTDTFTIYNKSPYKVIAMKLKKDAGLYSQVSVSIYVKALYNNSSQTIKIYPYKSDGNSLNTSYSSTYTISKTGWTQIDLTSLASKMKGFGWMKFRITCTSTSLDVAEGNFIVK